jgi:hypothetical protein
MDDLQIIPDKRWLEILFLAISDLAGFAIAIGFVALVRYLVLGVDLGLIFDVPGIRTLQILLLF